MPNKKIEVVFNEQVEWKVFTKRASKSKLPDTTDLVYLGKLPEIRYVRVVDPQSAPPAVG